MNRINAKLIEGLVDDLAPVRALRLRDGVLWLAGAVAVTVVGVELYRGVRRTMFTGDASPYFFIANLMLLVLGIASAMAVIRIASPGVGNRYDGPRWGLAMLGVLPLVTVVYLLASERLMAALTEEHGPPCFENAMVASIGVAAALVFWLRRGAPVALNSAGMFTGVAAGALGSFAYGLACPLDTLAHLSIWHILPVAVAGLIGRIAVPWLVRW